MGISPCAPQPITPGIVTFDPVAFIAAFPRFKTPTGMTDAAWQAVLTGNFNLATLQLNNSCGSVVCDAPTRATLLNLLVAHITQTLYGIDGLPPSDVVGRINSAQEGSASLQSEYDAQ